MILWIAIMLIHELSSPNKGTSTAGLVRASSILSMKQQPWCCHGRTVLWTWSSVGEHTDHVISALSTEIFTSCTMWSFWATHVKPSPLVWSLDLRLSGLWIQIPFHDSEAMPHTSLQSQILTGPSDIAEVNTSCKCIRLNSLLCFTLSEYYHPLATCSGCLCHSSLWCCMVSSLPNVTLINKNDHCDNGSTTDWGRSMPSEGIHACVWASWTTVPCRRASHQDDITGSVD